MRDHISALLRKPWAIPALAGVAGLTGGVGIGYILGKKKSDKVWTEVHEQDLDTISQYDRLTDNMQETIEEQMGELAAMEAASKGEHPSRGPKPPVAAHPELATQAYLRPVADIIEKSDPEPKESEPEPEPEIVNIFESDSTWDYEAELAIRTPDLPYTIHVDEFIADEMGYEQSTLTYYEGDDILVDEHDVPVYNHNLSVGPLNFGHGSNDKNVVYIRSERLESEFEVLREHGLYTVEVLGYEKEEEFRHSGHHSVPKFRPE